MSIKWLFFDMGSTLIDETICYEKQFQRIASAAHKQYEEIYSEAVALYKKNLVGNKELAKKYEVSLKWPVDEEKPYEDAAFCLKKLRTEYKIGIIANQNYGAKQRLQQYGLLDNVDLVVTSAEEGIAKPDRRLFEIARARSNCLATEAVMIGDRVDNDIIPAKAVGMKTIWIRQGFGKYWKIQGEEERADITVCSLQELLTEFEEEKV